MRSLLMSISYGRMLVLKFSHKHIVPLAIGILLITLSLTFASNPVSSCATLTNSTDTYTLTGNIVATGSCFTFSGPNIVLDCQFHSITGSAIGSGISIDPGSYGTVRNCIVNGFAQGITVNGGGLLLETSHILNNTIGMSFTGNASLATATNSIETNSQFNLVKNQTGPLSAPQVWWGVNTTAQIAATISGNVSFQPALTYNPFGDADGDGIPFIIDNCGYVQNPGQEDNDQDDAGNACDNCLMSYNFFQNDTDHDGIGDACDVDDDNDVICDTGSIITYLFNNVAPSATFSGYEAFGNLTPQLMIDNDPLTYFPLNKSGHGQFVMDLGNLADFSELRVDYFDSTSIPHTISFEISQDNSFYITLFNFTNNTPLNMGDDPFNSMSIENTYPVRYVRVIVYDTEIDENATAALNQNITNQTSGNMSNSSNSTNLTLIYTTTKITEISVSTANVTCRAGPNGFDNCQYITNANQTDGDNDTVGNACDNCLIVPNSDQGDRDYDGKGDACDQNIILRNAAFDPLTENVTLPSTLTIIQPSGYYIVQAFSGSEMNVSSALSTLNGTLFGFIPQSAFLFLTSNSPSSVSALPGVRSVNNYQPAYKLEPPLFQQIALNTLPAGSQTYEVSYFQNKISVLSQVIALGGTITSPYLADVPNAPLVVTIAASELVNLSRISDVSFIRTYVPETLDLDVATTITEVRPGVNLPSPFGLSGLSQFVGIRDTGIDTGNLTTLHTDLRGRITIDPNTPAFADTNGHGTHTSGILGGAGNLSAGRFKGAAPRTQILFSSFAVAPALAWNNAIAQGASIHTNSWGMGAGTAYGALEGTVDTTLNTNQQFLIVKSAGNNGPPISTITSPAGAKNIISVANSENERPAAEGIGAVADNRNHLKDSSSRGPGPNNQIKPDLTAPGTFIVSTMSTLGTSACTGAFPSNRNYSYCTGTSMAAPHVAGTAALIREYVVTSKGNPGPTGMLLKALLVNGAQDIPDTGVINAAAGATNRGTGPIPNTEEGWGRINLTNTINPNNAPSRIQFIDNQQLTASKKKMVFNDVRFTSPFPTEITLVWFDPADTGGTGALVNNLDLTLSTPDGTTIRGGAPSFANGESQTNAAADTTNAVEKIYLKKSVSGYYNITVEATTLTTATQNFALVYSQIVGVDAVNSTNNVTSDFIHGETVYAKAIGLPTANPVDVYVIEHHPEQNFTTPFSLNGLDISGGVETIAPTTNGNITALAVWQTSQTPAQTIITQNNSYHLVIDINQDQMFTPGLDIADYNKKPGFFVDLFEVHVINVGVGESILLKNGNHTILFDAGSQCDGCNSGYPVDAISKYLKSIGVYKIDAFVLSHDHSDHYSRIPELVTADIFRKGETKFFFRTATTCNPQPIIGSGCTPSVVGYKTIAVKDNIDHALQTGMPPPTLLFKYGRGVDINVLNDGHQTGNWIPILGENDHSIVLKLIAGNTDKKKYTFGGDCGGGIMGDCEDSMLTLFSAVDLKTDVYKVEHHGSITSTIQNYINTLNPTVSINSGGEHGNMAPDPYVENRLRDKNMIYCSTHVHGDLFLYQDIVAGSADIKRKSQYSGFGQHCPDVYLYDTGTNKAIWELKQPAGGNFPALGVKVKDLQIASGSVDVYVVDHQINFTNQSDLRAYNTDKITVSVSGNQGQVPWPTLIDHLKNETVLRGHLGYDLIIDVDQDHLFDTGYDYREAGVALPQENTNFIGKTVPWHLRPPSFKYRSLKAMGINGSRYDQRDTFAPGEDIHFESAGIKREVGELLIDEFLYPSSNVDSIVLSGPNSASVSLGAKIVLQTLANLQNRKYKIYVVKHSQRPTVQGQALTDITGPSGGSQPEEFTDLLSHAPPDALWTPQQSDAGEYDLVLDMRIGSDNPNGVFDPKYDLVTGTPSKATFTVGCGPNVQVCGTVKSAEADDVEQNVFTNIVDSKADVSLFSSITTTAILHVVNSNSPVIDLDGLPYIDVSPSTPLNVPLVAGQVYEALPIIFPAGADKFGDYELIIDVDGDGIFNTSEDIYDPDGFQIVRELTTPRIAIDGEENVHLVTVERFFNSTVNAIENRVLYAKIDKDHINVKDTEHPELFDWSNDYGVANFKVLYRRYGGRIDQPDITVDDNGGPAVIFRTHVAADYDWLIFLKLNNLSERDYHFRETAPGANDGDPLDVLYYYFQDFSDSRLFNPSIDWDHFNDQPVFSAYITQMYPDLFYLNEIYPLLMFQISPIFFPHPLVPPFFTLTLTGAPIVFWGESIQVARPDLAQTNFGGLHKWPFGWDYFGSTTKQRYNAALFEVSSVTAGITGTTPHGDKWNYIPVAEFGRNSAPTFNYFYSDLDVDKNGDVHVAWFGPQDPLILGTPQRVKYAKVTDVTLTNPVQETVLATSQDANYHYRPSISVDKNNLAHIVYQSGNQIRMISSDNTNDVAVATLNTNTLLAKPSLDVGRTGDPHITWLDKDSSGNSQFWYREGKANAGSISFTKPAVQLVNGTSFPGQSATFSFPHVQTNKEFEDQTWADKTYVTWLEGSDVEGSAIKVKRTLPQLVFNLIIDGVSEQMLNDNLDQMPSLKAILDNHQNAKIALTPETIASSLTTQTNMLTGAPTKDHKIHGNNFNWQGTLKEYVPVNTNDLNEITGFLSQVGVRTIYQCLKDNGYSSAVLGHMIHGGVTSTRPDFLAEFQGDLSSGTISNQAALDQYFDDLDNNDDVSSNDASHLLTYYLLKHDHGTALDLTNFPYAQIDSQFGTIVDQLKEHGIFNDTLFVITSNHGLKDVDNDEAHALNDNDAYSPSSTMMPSGLAWNGEYAYFYAGTNPSLTTVLDNARNFYLNAFAYTDSDFYNKIDKVLVKSGGTYMEYSTNGTTNDLTPSSLDLTDFLSDASPDVLLVAKIALGFYFGDAHEAIPSSQAASLPLILAGDGFDTLGIPSGQYPSSANTVDMAASLIHMVAGNEIADACLSAIESDSVLETALEIGLLSPAEIRITDSAGRVTGRNVFGQDEQSVPASLYVRDDKTNDKFIRLAQAPDTYTLEVFGTGSGKFHLYLKKKGPESLYITYPAMSVELGSRGLVSINPQSSFALSYDFDHDGTYESTVPAQDALSITEDVDHTQANATIISYASNSTLTIDVSRSTNLLVHGISNAQLSAKQLRFKKIKDETINSTGFYSPGFVYLVDDVTATAPSLDNATLTLVYSDNAAIGQSIAENGYKIFMRDATNTSWIMQPTSVNAVANHLQTVFSGTGIYTIASNDQLPILSALNVSPTLTNIPLTPISVSVHAQDNGQITSVTATLQGQTAVLNFVSGTLWSGSITGPNQNGTFPLIVTAQDDTNNTRSLSSAVTLDQSPPIITIVEPNSTLFVTNSITLRYYTNEQSTQYYYLDGGSPVLVNNTEAFINGIVQFPTVPSGTHTLQVSATDSLGNTGFSPVVLFSIADHNIALTDMSSLPFYRPAINATIGATIQNTLTTAEPTIPVQFLVDGIVQQTQTVNLSGLATATLNFTYISSNGRHALTVQSVALANESYQFDNNLSAVTFVTNKIPLLFVDDDNSTTIANNSGTVNLADISDNDKYDVLYWDTQMDGPLTPSFLIPYPGIFWFSDQPNSMSPAETTLLRNYLLTGGNLMISSRTLASSLATSQLFNTMKIGFSHQGSGTTLEGILGDPIGFGLLFTITQPGDTINPTGNAISGINYQSGGSASVRTSSTGQSNLLYHSVYYPFNINDAIQNGVLKKLIDRTLVFFDIDITPPSISALVPVNHTYDINTTSIVMRLTTDETAQCAYIDSRLANSSVPFSFTGNLQHNTTISNLQNGQSYAFPVTCSDDQGNDALASATFTVANRTFTPPFITSFSTVFALENQTVTINPIVLDAENDPITLIVLDKTTYGYVPIASRFAVNGTTLRLNTTFFDSGNYTLILQATDAFNSSSLEFGLVVINVNRPPTIAVIPPLFAPEDSYFTYTISATDPDGEALLITDNTPLFVTNQYLGSFAFTPKHPNVGIYNITMSATDGNLSASRSFTMTVTNTNDRPLIAFIPAQRSYVNESFNYLVTATDPDNNSLSYFDNTSLFNITANGLIDFMPTPAQLGEHSIAINVSDGFSIATRIMNIVVLGNHSPLVHPIANITVNLNGTFTVNVTACDPDFDPTCS